MDDETRERLRTLEAAATPGPWALVGRTSIESDHPCGNQHQCRGVASTSLMGPPPYEQWRPAEEADAALIAAARNALPGLLDALDAAEAERDSLRAGVAELQALASDLAESSDPYDWAASRRIRAAPSPTQAETEAGQ